MQRFLKHQMVILMADIIFHPEIAAKFAFEDHLRELDSKISRPEGIKWVAWEKQPKHVKDFWYNKTATTK